MNVIEAAVATPDARVAIVIARFNNFINDSLLSGALDALKRIGQVKDENITVVWVPGAYEMPMTARALAKPVSTTLLSPSEPLFVAGLPTSNMSLVKPVLAWPASR